MPTLVRLICILIAFGLGGAQPTHAGYFLHVHFGDPIDARSIKSASEIVTSPIGARVGDLVTANFLLELTGDSTLYFYRFSVRYNDDRLEFVERDEPVRPPNWDGILGLVGVDSAPLPTDQSAVSPLIGNFRELGRFDGESDGPGSDIEADFYHVGQVTYRLRATPLSGDLLIQPGKFELSNTGGGATIDPGLEDAFLAEDSTGTINVNITFQQGIVAVPEPSSLLLLALSISGFLGYRKFSKSRKGG